MCKAFLQIGSTKRNPKKKAQNKLLDQSTFDVRNRTSETSIILRTIRMIDDKWKYLLSSFEVILYRLISSSVNDNSDKNLNFRKKIKVSNKELMKNHVRNTQKASKGTIFLKSQQIIKVNTNFDRVKAISKWIMNLLPLVVFFKKPISISRLSLLASSLAHRPEKYRIDL